MIEKIEALRVRIDGLSQLVKELKPVNRSLGLKEFKEAVGTATSITWKEVFDNINSDEINKSYDSLILAKAWLGKILGELGTESPYANDGSRKEVGDIEPAADIYKSGIEIFKEFGDNLSHIEKVDWLREQIKDIDLLFELGYSEAVYKHLDLVYKHLCEARFWLGFELGRIRDAESN